MDKANVLDTSRLWRQFAAEAGVANSDIALDHMLVDTAAMQLVANPGRFDVVVTENMFGDILMAGPRRSSSARAAAARGPS